MKNDNRTLLRAAVDRLAVIKAQIAALAAEEKELKTVLAESGESVIEGTLHRAHHHGCTLPRDPFIRTQGGLIMFQIFDCTGQPIGRPEGYQKHRTAQSLTARAGRIRRAIWDAYYAAKAANPEHSHVYAIRWVDPVAAEIIRRSGVPAGRLIVSHIGA